MKVGFNKEGLTINSKKFDPLNISARGHGIESERAVNDADAFEILNILASARTLDKDATAADKINVMKTLMDKVNS